MSVCVLSPACPFVKKASHKPPRRLRTEHPLQLPTASFKVSNLVGDEVMRAGKSCVSQWSLHQLLVLDPDIFK